MSLSKQFVAAVHNEHEHCVVNTRVYASGYIILGQSSNPSVMTTPILLHMGSERYYCSTGHNLFMMQSYHQDHFQAFKSINS